MSVNMENRMLYTENGSTYTVERFINSGTFGEVFQVRNKRNNMKYAMKMFIASKFNSESKSFDVESFILDLAEENNVKELVQSFEIGMLLDHPDKYASNYIAMELLGMSLFDMQCGVGLKDKNGKFFEKYAYSYDNIKSFGYQMAKAMDFLHNNDILHLDLKPENVFLVRQSNRVRLDGVDRGCGIFSLDDTRIKVGDYGCSVMLDENVEGLYGKVQTQNYRALEVFLGQKYTKKTDVWSFGCILAELYTGELLFYGSMTPGGADVDDEEIQLNVIEQTMMRKVPQLLLEDAYDEGSRKVKELEDGSFAFYKDLKEPVKNVKTLPECARYGETESVMPLFSLIIRCLLFETKIRPGFDRILENPFFNGMKDE